MGSGEGGTVCFVKERHARRMSDHNTVCIMQLNNAMRARTRPVRHIWKGCGACGRFVETSLDDGTMHLLESLGAHIVL